MQQFLLWWAVKRQKTNTAAKRTDQTEDKKWRKWKDMRLDKTNLPVSISRWCLHISLKRFSGGSNHCCLFFPQLLIQNFPSRLFSLADFCNLCPSPQSCHHSSAVPLFPLSSGRIRVGKPGGICAFFLPQIKTVSFSRLWKGPQSQ